MTHPDKAVEDGYNQVLQAAGLWKHWEELWDLDFPYEERSNRNATSGGKQPGQA